MLPPLNMSIPLLLLLEVFVIAPLTLVPLLRVREDAELVKATAPA
ncbi:hypothetical protein [Rickettsia helvetica]|nr:hypothetical protein [Rickettsia helvetica]